MESCFFFHQQDTGVILVCKLAMLLYFLLGKGLIAELFVFCWIFCFLNCLWRQIIKTPYI